MNGPRLSLCVIARDEEAMLGACLASARPAVDEMIVVDTGSTDETVSVALRAGATVVRHAWADDFAQARNAALAKARGAWILVLDADERLAPGGASALRAFVDADEGDCGFLPLHNAARVDAPVDAVLSGRARLDEPVLLPRLVRRTQDLRWTGAVHESVGPWLARGRRSARVEAPIVHLGNIPEIRLERGKARRNLALLQRRCAVEPGNPTSRTWLARELLRAGDGTSARAQIERAWAALVERRASGKDDAAIATATLRAFLALEDGDLDRAHSTVATAESWGEAHPNLDLLAASSAERAGGFDQAAFRLHRCLAAAGRVFADELLPGATGFAARTLHGVLALRRGDGAAALRWFEGAKEECPHHLPARLGAAHALLLLGRPGEALAAVEPLLPSGGPDGWIVAAAAALAVGQAGVAGDLRGRARDLEPQGYVSPFRRELAERIDAELTALELAREVGLAGKPDLRAIAERLAAGGEAELAERALGAAAVLDPTSVEVFSARLGQLEETGEIARAVEVARARSEDPLTRAALRRLGVEEGPGAGDPLPACWLMDGSCPRAARGLRDAGYAVRVLPLDAATSLARALARAWETTEAEAVARLLSAETPARVDLPPGAPAAWRRLYRGSAVEPLLSVIVPTRERRRALRNLLDRLSLQDLPPSLFEAVVADDGSTREPAEPLGRARRPFALRILRQEAAGPAAARNLALAHCRGRWVVIFNDDALPAPDNLRLHLLAQARSEGVVLGSFDFTARCLRRPFVRLLQDRDRLFEFHRMTPGEAHSWRFFYTCNLSMPRKTIAEAGGFDAEGFPRAICEDSELGLRIERTRGTGVRYEPAIRAEHDHEITPGVYARRAFQLGWYNHRIWQKHRERSMVALAGEGDPDATATWLGVRARVESLGPVARAARDALEALDRREIPEDTVARSRLLDRMDDLALGLADCEYSRGQAACQAGLPDLPIEEDLESGLVSVVVPNLNGMPHLVDMVESLRRTAGGPTELIVVDNGSTDGSLAWLRAQSDLLLLELGTNAGAPAARNRGLERARGETIVLCDNDVVFTPGWRERTLGHLAAWPDVGMVGPMSDYVIGAQKAEEEPSGDLDAFARAWTDARRGAHAYTTRLILFFVVLRRAVIDQIGGIEEIYGRWGFEDDDISLRAALAGWKLRIARDCFIRHLGSRTAATAGLDYGALLRRNWEVFKERWGIDPALPYGEGYDPNAILRREFDPAVHRVPLRAFEWGDEPVRLLAGGGEREEG